MTKLLAILFILIYSGTAAGGVRINFHYCHNQLAKISFLNFEGKTGCGCNPKDMLKGYCKDELKNQKSDTHRTVQPDQIADITSFAVELSVFNNNFTIPLFDKDGLSPIATKVLRTCPESLYLLNRVFRI